MKDYQDLIGKLLIAIAIVIAGVLIANAISGMGVNINSGLNSASVQVWDGLVKVRDTLTNLAPTP